MKKLIISTTIISLFLIFFGLLFKSINVDFEFLNHNINFQIKSDQVIGSGVVILFFIVFPVFSYYRWKDKDVRDYMLTQENVDKMNKTKKRN
ncbi:MAG: amino acid transporter [Flavobacteriaceae bacterium]|mgnify:CR=1 FL=1|jgi:amino acid transporter|tara:strand:- start:180 stop:455 length:276 start_codon:yes stop_codon:yes gene_type:complete